MEPRAEAYEYELDRMLEEEMGVTREGFVIDDDYKAEWALGKIAGNNKDYERFSSVLKRKIEFCRYQDEEARKRRDAANEGLISMLEQYFDGVETKKTKTQATYKLPSGKLIKKFDKETLEHDDDVLIEALKGTEFIENVPKLKWGEYKKTLQVVDGRVVNGDGEIVEGVTVEIKQGEFYVEV